MFPADAQPNTRNSKPYQDFIKYYARTPLFLQNIGPMMLLLLFNISNLGGSNSSLNRAQLTAKTCWLLAMAEFLRPFDLERVDLDTTTVSFDKVLSLSIVAPEEKSQGQCVTKVIMLHPHTNPLLYPVAVFEEYKQRIASSDRRAVHPLFLKSPLFFSFQNFLYSIKMPPLMDIRCQVSGS